MINTSVSLQKPHSDCLYKRNDVEGIHQLHLQSPLLNIIADFLFPSFHFC